jgi:hypothetical protein
MWISAVCIVAVPLMIVVGIVVILVVPGYEPPTTSNGSPGVVPASSGRDAPASGGADTAGDAYLHTSMLAHCTGGAGLSEAKCGCIIGRLEAKYGIRGAYDVLATGDEQESIDAVRRLGC